MKTELLALAALIACSAACAQGGPPLTVSRDGVALRDGKPYRGIGVNYFDVFARTLKDPNDRSYDEGFATLKAHGIPFVRFMCGGFWPVDMKLYREDRARYFALLDAVVASAEKHGIGLVPSLFWNVCTVPDLVGEPCDQWGNPASKTHEAMRTYVREVVQRYGRSRAIWMWEFGNEYNLAADLPNAAEHRPAAAPHLGTPASRSERDELTYKAIRTAFTEFAREVRKYDRRRPITTGNAFPRPSAYHQMVEKSWTADSGEERARMLADDNPDPINVLSVHAYDDYARIAEAMNVARIAKKPLFVGEFGVDGAGTPASRQKYAAMLDAIVKEGVPLAALWVYDFGAQTDYSVTPTNARAWLLEGVKEANRRIREGG